MFDGVQKSLTGRKRLLAFAEGGGSDNWQPYYDFRGGYTSPDGSGNGGKPPKNNSSTVIVIVVCVAVFLLLAGLAVIGILGLGLGGLPSLTGSDVQSGVQSATSQADGIPSGVHSYSGDDLDISISDVASSTAEQTGVVVANKVCPSIVGVLNYESDRTGGYTLLGTGSGIILSEDGFIVTNYHVIEGADMVAVTLYSESGMSESDSYIADVVGGDSTTDIALLKINVSGLIPAEFADSDQILVGETVYAVGNPGGLELSASITQGLISGINRNLGTMGFIQTDVAINPGNSGGALVNVYGQVIGITSEKIISVSDISAEGLGLAIPSNLAVDIVQMLLEYGYVPGRISLGITVTAYTDAYAEAIGLPDGCRLFVESVEPGSNAAGAGLESGVFITQVNGQPVASVDQLRSERDKCLPGDSISLTVYSPGAGQYYTVTFIAEEDRG